MAWDYFGTVLVFCGMGLLFGFFPGYFTLIFYVARAFEVERREVPGWLLFLSGRDTKTMSYDFDVRGSKASQILTWALFSPWILMVLVTSGDIASTQANGDIAKQIIIQITFPLVTVLTWTGPTLWLLRYIKTLDFRV